MRTLLLTDAFLPHMGGSRVYYYNLYKSLVSQYSDQVMVLTKKVPGWREFDRAESAGPLRIFRRGRPLPTLKYWQLPKITAPLLDTLRILRRERIEVTHAGDLYPQGVISVLFKRWLGVPFLAYCHGEQITQTEPYRFQPILRNWVYRHADAVVANSDFTRNHLVRIGIPPERIHMLTPGVDCDRFSPRPRNPELVRQLGIEGKRVVLTVSRLVPRKGHRAVLQAMARLTGGLHDCVYLIAGEGPEEESLRRMAAELGIQENVIFLGRVSSERLPDIFNLCDVFVMPNYEAAGGDIEGFGMVFLEANAAGKPVIGGRSGGSVDAVVDGETGVLVDGTNIDELAGALERLLQDGNLRARLGSAGLARAREHFSWAARAQHLREINRRILCPSATRTVENPASA
jgi:phosphatidylinositol alpha-1,6-mannosyltransferase